MLSFSSEKPRRLSSLAKWIRAFIHKLRSAIWSSCSSQRRIKKEPKRMPTSGHNSRLSSAPFATMEVSNQLKQVFQLIDSNGDGKISPVELREVLLRLGHEESMVASEAEGMVKEVDCDGDGLIDLEEFMGVVGDDGGGGGGGSDEEKVLAEAFRVFDADGNGFISAEELRRVLVALGHGGCSLGDCSRMIGGVDRNGDGLVDFEEFRSMMTLGRVF